MKDVDIEMTHTTNKYTVYLLFLQL